jgi:hypothetical protein
MPLTVDSINYFRKMASRLLVNTCVVSRHRVVAA